MVLVAGDLNISAFPLNRKSEDMAKSFANIRLLNEEYNHMIEILCKDKKFKIRDIVKSDLDKCTIKNQNLELGLTDYNETNVMKLPDLPVCSICDSVFVNGIEEPADMVLTDPSEYCLR